ncbi:bckd-1A, partial [Symbiodinium microadriaticum]
MFQVMDVNGNKIPSAPEVNIDKDTIIEMYRVMVRLQALDDVFYNAQRQGRISFYMQSAGEEGAVVGSAAALEPQDVVFSQYRESGVLLWRGFTVQQAADQCFANEMDLGKGRQMPAAGAAYALKLNPNNNAVAVCYFGEGAASEGDFHAAMNFAATTEAPCVFFCRNNGYAISTPTRDQYRGDGIISRAAGYGMKAIRVDGNDTFAVYMATMEVMSYRRGHHSTSDDSTRYRSSSEINKWGEMCPLRRLRAYMEGEGRGWWSDEQEAEVRDAERMGVLRALETAEKRPPPPVSELFADVYDVIPPHLAQQEEELYQHMEKYPEHYKN